MKIYMQVKCGALLSGIHICYVRDGWRQWAILTHKVGQTDLFFGMQSGFISRSVSSRVQSLVCSGYNFCHTG